MSDDKTVKRLVLLVLIGVAILLVAGLLTFMAISIADNLGKPSSERRGVQSVDSLNACCWFRVVGDWKPGRVRHWFAGRDAVAVVEDQETGYCHLVGLEDINFSQEKPW